MSWNISPEYDRGNIELSEDCPYFNVVKDISIFPKFIKGVLDNPVKIDYLVFGGERYYKK